MVEVRRNIEEGFATWSRLVVRYRVFAILSILATTAFLITRIPLMQVETSSEDYLFDGDPAKIAYNEFRDQFGRDQLILVVIEPPEVFNLGFLEWLRGLHRDLEASVPHLDDVTSLVNVRSVYGVGDELFVDDLLKDWPTSAADLEAIRERTRATESYHDAVISVDGRTVAIQVKSFAYSDDEIEGGALAGFDSQQSEGPRRVLSARENTEFSRAVIEVIDRHRRDDYTMHLTGQPLVAFALTGSMREDIPKIFGGALLLVGLMIVGLFRRLSPILLSTAVVVLSLLSTLGIAQLLGFPISLPTQILPSFMLAVGVGYVVY